MANRKAAFKQNDVKRAIKGALAAGLPVWACQICPDGSICLRFTQDEGEDGPNDFDEVLRQ